MLDLGPAEAAKLARSPVVVLSANRFTSQLVRSLFFGLGMRDVTVAPDMVNALERFQLCRLDLMVADTGPSTFDPTEAILVLRQMHDQRQAKVPIILLTMPNVAPAGAADLGRMLVLQKPLSISELRRAVFRLLLNIEDKPRPEDAKSTPQRSTALLLTGNPYTAQVVRTLLLSAGLSDLAVAGTPGDAEQKLACGGFDLVIADSGPASFDALAALETARSPLDVPVLVLASNPSATLVERARAAQVKAIAAKPLDPGSFADRVSKVLNSSSR